MTTAEELLDERQLYSGLIRLHILHHAARGGIFGLGMIEELARHGYKLSPGTLYPILHGLEKRGLLTSEEHGVDGKVRRVYLTTAAGQRALASAKGKVRELFGELFEDGRVVQLPRTRTRVAATQNGNYRRQASSKVAL